MALKLNRTVKQMLAEANAEVEVTLENGAMITRAAAQPRYTLDELVHRITSENQHPETETGPVVGREVW